MAALCLIGLHGTGMNQEAPIAEAKVGGGAHSSASRGSRYLDGLFNLEKPGNAPANAKDVTFWGWNRPITASDVRGLMEELVTNEGENREIWIFSGTHGDEQGRCESDAKNSGPSDDTASLNKKKTQALPGGFTDKMLRETKFRDEDLDTVRALRRPMRAKHWGEAKVLTADNWSKPGENFVTHSIKEIKATPPKHVIFAFCFSAGEKAGQGGLNTESVSQKTIAKTVWGMAGNESVSWAAKGSGSLSAAPAKVQAKASTAKLPAKAVAPQQAPASPSSASSTKAQAPGTPKFGVAAKGLTVKNKNA